MRLFFLIFLLVPLQLKSQLRDSIYIQTSIFDVVYSEVLEQPKWVEYNVICQNGTISRKGMDFYTIPNIKTSSNEDYENNIWDKGHVAPAADFNCNKETLKLTFTYLNCMLQHEKLNRGVWKLLEQYERDLSKQGSVRVEVKINFSKNSKVLPTGATIPDSFTKIITTKNTCEKYLFKNEEPKYPNYQMYKVK